MAATAGLLAIMMGVWLWTAGCGPDTIDALFGASRPYVPAYFIRADGLEAPAVNTSKRVFKPAATLPAESGIGEHFGFRLVVAASTSAVDLRLVDQRTSAVVAIDRFAPPAGAAEQALAAALRPYSDAMRSRLAAGAGVCWFEGSSGLEQHLACLLPVAVLTPATRLEMSTSRAGDGTPVGADGIALVRDFFYLAVIGDSVLWGNGLEERDKISSLVTQRIESDTGRKVILQRFAQNGATIVPTQDDGVCPGSCSGEVIFVPTSITTQVGLVARPELMDLVLMDGCANDISIATVISPVTTDEELTTASTKFCNEAMTGLLRSVRERMPNASIVVTGYYPFLSDESSALALRVWEIARGAIQPDGEAPLLPELVHQSELFRDATTADLTTAVATVNGDASGRPKIALAVPDIGPSHATFAPDAWLWGVTAENHTFVDLNLNLDLFPEDPVQSARVQLCLDPANKSDLLTCLYASVAHPNVRGAQAYAEVVIQRLGELGILPASH